MQVKKRLLNKVAGGVVVFGAAPDPIEIYRGPTGRRALNYNDSQPKHPQIRVSLAYPHPHKHYWSRLGR